jgi:hypothetical protein
MFLSYNALDIEEIFGDIQDENNIETAPIKKM